MTNEWASAAIADRITPITADELASAELPAASRRDLGYARAATDLLLARALLALRLGEEQLGDMAEAVAGARAVAAAAPQAQHHDPDRDVEAAVARWLDALAPEQLDRLVSDLAARQIVDAAAYAEALRREARDRVWVVIDLLAEAAGQLARIVDAAHGSLDGQHRLPGELRSWRGRYDAAVTQVFATLDLPQSAKVRTLLTVAARELAVV